MTVESNESRDNTTASSVSAVIHDSSDAPLCDRCKQLDLSFFDPICLGCREILREPCTTIPQLFAILRQWVPQTQQNINIIINEILNRGANINDRDRMTDMTLLHYACKSGANGVGDIEAATQVVKMLLNRGADIGLRCSWTNMSALHYASYFNVAPVIDLLLTSSNRDDKDSTCLDFENGTSLHIAAANLCLDAVNMLLKHGCDATIRDDVGRLPLECISSADIYQFIQDTSVTINELKSVLKVESNSRSSVLISNASGKAVLQSMGLSIGDDVLVNIGSHSYKIGKMRFCGKTAFAHGIWVGVELDCPSGRNDGSIDGISYFKCPENHGIFVKIDRVSKQLNGVRVPSSHRQSCSPKSINHPKIDVSHVTSKIETGLSSLRMKYEIDLKVGDRVWTLRNKGTIMFCGQTHFAPGWWYGVRLDDPSGKNDGSVNFIRYFICDHNHGIFVPPTRIARLSDSKEDLSRKELSSLFGIAKPKTPKINTDTDNNSEAKRKPTISPRMNSPQNDDSHRWLFEGTKVLVHNEIGTVKYIGEVDFANGIWVGVELRSRKGKNDGVVQGKRYFTCKNLHGIMVRPSKVSIRGINGAKLIRS